MKAEDIAASLSEGRRKIWSPGPIITAIATMVTLNCVDLAFGNWASAMLAFSMLGFVVGWLARDVRSHLMKERGG